MSDWQQQVICVGCVSTLKLRQSFFVFCSSLFHFSMEICDCLDSVHVSACAIQATLYAFDALDV